tara:strand:- start:450 stop:1190 length:741 start_codon:yes stop_codon:yes gene_type:complete
MVPKIIVMMRFPKFEKSIWKKNIIKSLIENKYEVSLLFAHSSYFEQVKYAYKFYGNNIFSKYNQNKSIPENDKNINLSKYFSKHVKTIYVNNPNSKKSQIRISKLNPDLLLLLGTGIIKRNILLVPKIGTIHIHQGFLPKFRGVNTIEWSIYSDEDVYISSHFVDVGIDTGNIIMRKKINYNNLDSIETIRERCKKESLTLILESIEKIINGNKNFVIQKKIDGKQFFSMHPLFIDKVNDKIKSKK